MKSKDKIAIGWIDPGVVDGWFAISIMNLYHDRHSRIGQVIRVEAGGLISRGRNEIVAAFLESSCDWLFMIDSDERMTVDAFDKLVAVAHSVERPFVAGLYFGQWNSGVDIYAQPIPLIFDHHENGTQYQPLDDYPPNKVIAVAAAGTGCLLVHRSVFEAIRDTSTQHEARRWCWFQDLPVNGEWFGEDMYFCRRVETLGFPMVAHTGVILDHRKRYWLNDSHHERYKVLTRGDPDGGDAPA